MATTAGTDHVVRDVAGEDGLAVSLGVDWDLDPLEVVGQEESYVLVRVGQVCGLSPHLLHWSDPSQWSYRSSPGESLHLPSWRTPRAARWGPWSQKAHWRWRGKCRDQRRGRSNFRGTPYFWCPCSDGRPPGSCREPRRWSCRREPAGPRSSGRRWWPGSCSRWSRRRCDCRDSSERLATGTRLTIGANIEMNIDIYYSRLGASSPPIILPSVSLRSFPNWGLAPARLRQARSTSIIIVGSSVRCHNLTGLWHRSLSYLQ